MDINNERELYNLVKKYYGYKVKMSYVNSQNREVVCILYNAFLFICNISGEHGTFGGGILLNF